MRVDADTYGLIEPLVSRPGYGEGQPAMPVGVGPVGTSKLPSGDPGGKGLSLDKDIPGSSTFNKPEDDIREFDKAEEGSIYRIDGPDDRAKPQNDPKDDERHHEQFKPSIGVPGPRDDDDSITKYPYRDGIPNAHNASAEFVVALFKLASAPERLLVAGGDVRVAARIDEIVSGLNPKTVQRAAACSATMKRADIPNLRWIFSVDCGNGAKAVKVKAVRKGNVTKISKMDLLFACSCNAWQWLGSEHHAKGEQYLDGKPRGTAATPVVKDPQGINRVCKHVASAISSLRSWELPKPKGKAKKASEEIDLFGLVRRASAICGAANALDRRNFEAGHHVVHASPSFYVRAVGDPEGVGAYQIRAEAQPWPQSWIPTEDLAEAMLSIGVAG